MKPVYLYITSFFPSPTSWRGAFCYDFVRALQRTEKYDVRVFVPGKGEDYDYQGIHVYRFPTRCLPSGIFPFLFSAWNKKSFLRKLEAVGINPESVAVCHSTDGIYVDAVKKLNPGCLALQQHHNLASFGGCNGRLRHFWLHKVINFPIYRKYHELMDAHVFLSRAAEKSFRAVPDASWSQYEDYRRQMRGLGFFRGPKIKRSILLHNGVDMHQFNPAGRKPHDGFVIGCIGNFNQIKDQITLLKALDKIKGWLGNWRLRFIGSGPLLQQCKDYVAENKLEDNVSFESEVDHTQLPDFYRSLDLFVLPSYFEGFGCVFTEAYACGMPFITCEGQGIDDLIPEAERPLWLCKQRDPNDLAEKILAYYQHRPVQHLSGPIDIDTLVLNFVKEVETLKRK